MKKTLSLIIKGAGAISGILGLWLNFAAVENPAGLLTFFTIQSNIFCVLMFISLFVLEAIKKLERNRAYVFFKGAVTLCIFVTFLVYNVLLRPQMFAMGGGDSLSNVLVHVITPLIAVLDYIVCDTKGAIGYKMPIYWTLTPCYYLVFVLVYNLLGGKFELPSGESPVPYFFLDTGKYGWGGVLLWTAGIFLFFLLLAYLTAFIDKKWGGRKRIRE